MNISWYGLSCLKIEGKNNQEDIVLLTDPFDGKKFNLKTPRNWRTDIALQSLADEEQKKSVEPIKDGKKVFTVDRAGEYEKGGIFITAIKMAETNCLLYALEIDGVHLLYAGWLNRLPTEADLANIENVDVLLLPIGGHSVLTAKEAAELVSDLEPRCVIPLHYHLPGLKAELDGPETFLKIMGAKNAETLPKIKITKKDLPQEETKIYLLSPLE